LGGEVDPPLVTDRNDRAFEPIGALVVAAAGPLAEWWLRSKVTGQFAPKVLKLWAYLRDQKLTVTKDLVMMRGRSLFALAAKVFMRRIRSLSVTRLLTEPAMKDVALTNEIHDLLSCSRDWSVNPRYAGIPPPSAALLECARTAHEMDTLLWFQNAEQLPSLIAAGQATLCFNLLVHVRGRLIQFPGHPELVALELTLLGVWSTLAATPFALLTGRI
jgi:hypothetical protein